MQWEQVLSLNVSMAFKHFCLLGTLVICGQGESYVGFYVFCLLSMLLVFHTGGNRKEKHSGMSSDRADYSRRLENAL